MTDTGSLEHALADLESDLASRRTVTYYPDPVGRCVAVLTRDRCPSRSHRPIQLLRHGRFAYDLTHRVLPEELPLTGGLTMYDIHRGEPVCGPWPRTATGPVHWNAAGDALAGLRRRGDGPLVPWVARTADATYTQFDEVTVSHSLLGLRAARATVVDWLADGRIVVAREGGGDWSARDIVFDSAEEIWPSPVLHSLFRAARADVVVLDPATAVCRPLVAGGIVVCLEVAPDGRHVLLGAASDQDELRQLLTYDRLRYRVYDAHAGEVVWDVGMLRRDSLRWALEPGPPAGAGEAGLDAVDASGPGPVLVFCDDDGERAQFWSAWRPGAVPALIGEVAGSVVAWLPLSADRAIVTTRAAPDHVDLLTRRPPGRSTCELGGPVVDLRSVACSDGQMVAVTARRPSDGVSGQRVLRISSSGSLVPVDRDHRVGQWPVGPTESDRLWEERDETRVGRWHETSVSPPRRPVRVIYGELPESATYHLYLPDPPRAPGRAGLPVVVWLSAARRVSRAGRVDQASRASGEKSVSERPRLEPATPAWTYLPGCAVADLTCPLPWDEGATFTHIEDQLYATVADLVDELSAIGGMDTRRLVLGGHSFGAAAAAALLARAPDMFRCAVLRSGAYNRTLTPGGFQHEHRTLWQARDIYEGFTLAYAADRIRTPVLLMQGTADSNTVTTVWQARAFYDTLRTAGVRTRLVLLHNEGHIFHTREGILAAALQELTWIDRFTGAEAPVKDPHHPLHVPMRGHVIPQEVQ